MQSEFSAELNRGSSSIIYIMTCLDGFLNVSDLYDEEPSGCGLFAMLSELGMAKPMVLTKFCLEIRDGVRRAKAHAAHMCGKDLVKV